MSIIDEINAARQEGYNRDRRAVMRDVMRAIMKHTTDDELIEPIIKDMMSTKAFDSEEAIMTFNRLLDAVNKHEAIVLKNIADNA